MRDLLQMKCPNPESEGVSSGCCKEQQCLPYTLLTIEPVCVLVPLSRRWCLQKKQDCASVRSRRSQLCIVFRRSFGRAERLAVLGHPVQGGSSCSSVLEEDPWLSLAEPTLTSDCSGDPAENGWVNGHPQLWAVSLQTLWALSPEEISSLPAPIHFLKTFPFSKGLFLRIGVDTFSPMEPPLDLCSWGSMQWAERKWYLNRNWKKKKIVRE